MKEEQRKAMDDEIERRTQAKVDQAMAVLQKQQDDFLVKIQEQNSYRQYQSPVLIQHMQFGVSGHATQSGLNISANARSLEEQSKASVYPKDLRGQTDSDRLKRKRIVTEVLCVLLGVNNAISILANDQSDLTSDCQKSQVALREFYERCEKHDMVTPFNMPRYFNKRDSNSANSGPYINILKDHAEVTLEQAMEWQQFLNKHANTVEHESLL